MEKIGSKDMRKQFSQILLRAAYGKDRIIVTKNGKDIAALVPIEDLKAIEEQEDREDVRIAKRRMRNLRTQPWEEVKKELKSFAQVEKDLDRKSKRKG